MEFLARTRSGEDGKVIRLGGIPNAKSVEDLIRKKTSTALRYVGRAFMLAITSVVWAFVLMGAAAVLLVHLIVAAMAQSTFAAVSVALDAEAAANGDRTSAFDHLRGRVQEPSLVGTESDKPPLARAS
ncbi:MAG TPA: hypothetical protein VE825_18085 [Terriglobales bacterium]|jgi:hypothetical protein|nr:hypothetical protein [Terriglobales bacterium]